MKHKCDPYLPDPCLTFVAFPQAVAKLDDQLTAFEQEGDAAVLENYQQMFLANVIYTVRPRTSPPPYSAEVERAGAGKYLEKHTRVLLQPSASTLRCSTRAWACISQEGAHSAESKSDI